MNSKQRKAEQSRNYEQMKDIKRRLEVGEPTTYQERQCYYIYSRKLTKKQK